MNKVAKCTAALVGTVLLVLCSTSAANAAASHSGDAPPPDNKPDRVLYLDHPAPNLADARAFADGETGEASVATNGEFPVIPAPGETVRVVYTDAVTDVTTLESSAEALAASCTQSITVGTPYKASNRPRVQGSAMISTGCSSGLQFTIALWGGGYQRGSNSIFVPNSGNTWSTSAVGGECWDSGNISYFGIGSLSSIGGGSAWGPSSTLPCRYFI
ncbi:MAG TPA: hypothetical protein VJU58_10930 [Microbacterium sp.]|nr:hypothetical protein [Microbacterium sp.]